MKASTMDGPTLAKQLTALSGREWTFKPSECIDTEDDSIDCIGTGWHIQISEDGALDLHFVHDSKNDWWMRTLTTARDSSKLLNVIMKHFKGKTDLQLAELGYCGEHIS